MSESKPQMMNATPIIAAHAVLKIARLHQSINRKSIKENTG
jgi:hypothetical protein